MKSKLKPAVLLASALCACLLTGCIQNGTATEEAELVGHNEIVIYEAMTSGGHMIMQQGEAIEFTKAAAKAAGEIMDSCAMESTSVIKVERLDDDSMIVDGQEHGSFHYVISIAGADNIGYKMNMMASGTVRNIMMQEPDKQAPGGITVPVPSRYIYEMPIE